MRIRDIHNPCRDRYQSASFRGAFFHVQGESTAVQEFASVLVEDEVRQSRLIGHQICGGACQAALDQERHRVEARRSAMARSMTPPSDVSLAAVKRGCDLLAGNGWK